VNWRHVLSIAGGLAVLLNAGQTAGQPAPLQHEYHAAWIALASPEATSVRVESKSWAKLVTFRPERAFVLQAPLVESGTSKSRLEAGTVMVGMKDGRGVACRLERPTHVYFVECVEDADLDGQYEAFFLLNHENPFLFSARRQPRHQKVTPIQPVTLGEVAAEQRPTLDMVLIYSKRSVISAAAGAHTFQLCILKTGVRNIWGDKTVGRGCLPDVVVKDSEFPRQMKVYGRTLTIDAPVDGVVPVSVTAHPEDLPVAL
jgi:hypothetical protein